LPSASVEIDGVQPNSPAGYWPAFGPVVISKFARYGEKSSSVAMKNALSDVNSAWWPLPSGHSLRVPADDSKSSGSGFA
jgi:hypothetical protein